MNKNLVVLIYPMTGFDVLGVSVDLPLSLLYVAAPLVSQFDTRIIDQRIELNWKERLEELMKMEPLVVGLTVMTCPQITNAIEIAKIVKQSSVLTRVVWGGIHPTLFPEQVLRSGYADLVIREHGELPFQLLLWQLQDDYPLYENVPNLSWIQEDQYRETPVDTERSTKFDTQPDLPYNLIDVEKYIGSQGRFEDPTTRSLIVLTSTGCPYRCGYCSMPSMQSTKQRIVESVDHVLSRVEELVRTYNLNAISFHDEEFLLDRRRSLNLARGLLERFGGRDKFRWWCQTRMDSLERLGPDGLNLLYRSGLESFQPGIESGCDRILKLVDKRETVEQFTRINKLLAEFDFQPLYNFILGLPTETADEMLSTLRLAVQLLDENPNSMIAGVYSYVPYPGTPLFDKAIECGFESPKTLEEWSSFNRQTVCTPWVLNDPFLKCIVEYAVLTSRFVDGKRLPRRLSAALPQIAFSIDEFKDLSSFVKNCWRNDDVFSYKFLSTINMLCLKLFEAAKSY